MQAAAAKGGFYLTREITVAAGFPKALLSFATADGLDADALTEAVGLTAQAVDEPDRRVRLDDYEALLDAAVRLSGDPTLPLRFGEAIRMQEISIVGLICEAAPTTLEAGRQMNRYARLVLDPGAELPPEIVRGSLGPEGAWMEGVGTFFRTRHVVEAEFARLVENARRMFHNDSRFNSMKFLRAVEFMHEEPEHSSAYVRLFRAPIKFRASRNALLLDPAFLTLSQPPTSRYVSTMLNERARHLLDELSRSVSTRAQVISCCIPHIHTGELSMTYVARILGLSRRTLLRKLRNEGTSFEETLDDLRKELSLSYLHEARTSLKEIAYLLGFSDPSSFFRAHKRWYGCAPRLHRRTLARRLDAA